MMGVARRDRAAVLGGIRNLEQLRCVRTPKCVASNEQVLTRIQVAGRERRVPTVLHAHAWRTHCHFARAPLGLFEKRCTGSQGTGACDVENAGCQQGRVD